MMLGLCMMLILTACDTSESRDRDDDDDDDDDRTVRVEETIEGAWVGSWDMEDALVDMLMEELEDYEKYIKSIDFEELEFVVWFEFDEDEVTVSLDEDAYEELLDNLTKGVIKMIDGMIKEMAKEQGVSVSELYVMMGYDDREDCMNDLLEIMNMEENLDASLRGFGGTFEYEIEDDEIIISFGDDEEVWEYELDDDELTIIYEHKDFDLVFECQREDNVKDNEKEDDDDKENDKDSEADVTNPIMGTWVVSWDLTDMLIEELGTEMAAYQYCFEDIALVMTLEFTETQMTLSLNEEGTEELRDNLTVSMIRLFDAYLADLAAAEGMTVEEVYAALGYTREQYQELFLEEVDVDSIINELVVSFPEQTAEYTLEEEYIIVNATKNVGGEEKWEYELDGDEMFIFVETNGMDVEFQCERISGETGDYVLKNTRVVC